MLIVIVIAMQGDLGAIDEKYDVAISSSCGALDHILVDTIDTAQKCVTFLKQQNVGVATFIGLDKVNVLNLQRRLFALTSFLPSDEGLGKEHGPDPHP